MKSCKDLLKALKSEFSTEILDRSRLAQSKQLQDLIDNYLNENSKVLIHEKIVKLEKLLSLKIASVTLPDSSSLWENKTDLAKDLAIIYDEINQLLDLRNSALKELKNLHLQKAKRIFVSFEADLWTDYYMELSKARKNQIAFDDSLIDEDDPPFLHLENEIQTMLKSTQENIEEIEIIKFKKSVAAINKVFVEKLREFISGLDLALEKIFNQLDIISEVSNETVKKRDEATLVVSQLEEINGDLFSLKMELEAGLETMNKYPLSDRSKSFIDLDEPHIKQLWNIFGCKHQMQTGLIHKDPFISAARQWLQNIKQNASEENLLLEKCNKCVNIIKTLIKSSEKSICRFSASKTVYQKRPIAIIEREDAISRKVFQEFYPALRNIQ